jgi:hypothetical protein
VFHLQASLNLAIAGTPRQKDIGVEIKSFPLISPPSMVAAKAPASGTSPINDELLPVLDDTNDLGNGNDGGEEPLRSNASPSPGGSVTSNGSGRSPAVHPMPNGGSSQSFTSNLPGSLEGLAAGPSKKIEPPLIGGFSAQYGVASDETWTQAMKASIEVMAWYVKVDAALVNL